MNATTATRAKPATLDLQTLFSWLLADGIVDKSTVKPHFTQAQGVLRTADGAMHPLVAIAQCKIISALAPHRMLTLDALTEWCAGKVGLPFLRIDPLKIDFTKVADAMSATYAARFNILPVEAAPGVLVVATADPFRTEWRDEIARITRRRVDLVFANPLEIGQYLAVLHAGQVDPRRQQVERPGPGAAQQLRAAGRTGQVEQTARRQRPAHRQHRRLAVGLCVRTARLGYPPGTETRRRQHPLPHRRRAAPGLPGAGRRDDRDDRAH
jgi:hypothetical protein